MATANGDVARLFLKFSRHTLVEQYWPRLQRTVESLSDEQVWWRPNESSNSVGNLLLHLNGNVRQWLVTSFRESDDARDRPAEFRERQVLPARTLLDALANTIQEGARVLDSLREEDLVRRIQVQGYSVTGLDAVYHVIEHFGMHYGQIVYITKQLRNENLGFYRELDRTGRAGGHGDR